ncbi:MAG: APC family permease [Gammaproteobacteria bacterium]|nr:APC family permease [Gammaproteobacteria bacterium]MCI0591629.1 APC family permease [Gammaproteobacteria bacterium]
MSDATLARSLGLGALVFYGIGDILGAGIYALVGKVAGAAGDGAWLAFLFAGSLALVTGLSYAELSARIPHSAGACAYCANAFPHPFFPFLTGALVLVSGVTSTATVALAFQGYLEVFMALPVMFTAIFLILAINTLNFAGIRQSAATNNLFTIIEMSGLVLFVVMCMRYVASTHTPSDLIEKLAPTADVAAVVAGVTIAFYAFIGFEDLVNLAEEARDPVRDLPRAILSAIAITSLLYLLVIFTVQWTMTPAEASASQRPLLDALERAGLPIPAWGFALIAVIAIANTGLANSIMASRLLYGMATQGLLPKRLAQVHARRLTPWLSILVTALLSILLVITGGVTVLAQTTGFLLVTVFLIVHISLIRIRRRDGEQVGRFNAPAFNPYLGVLLCVPLLTQFPREVYERITLIVAGVGILFAVMQWSQRRSL